MQKELTEKWILPNREDILSDFFRLRAQVDDKLKHDPEVVRSLDQWKKEYPIGLCAEIRNAMLDMLFIELKTKQSNGIQAIRNFMSEGGEIIPFWGIDKDMYFQNAILLGDAVLDVANDTVFLHKKPIEFYQSHESSPLRMIESFSKVAEIAGKYWNYNVYPNIYLPELAPLFPILAVVKIRKENEGGDAEMLDGLILQQDFVDLHERNKSALRNGRPCGLASDFIFNSSYSGKRISQEMLQSLFQNHSLQGLLRVSADFLDVRVVFENLSVTKMEKLEKAALSLKGLLIAKVKK